MKFVNETFEFFDDRNSANVYSDIEFVNCHFLGCSFSTVDDVKFRSTVKNMTFKDCKITGGDIGAGIVENVVIDGLKIGNHMQAFGTAFKHVVIKGEIDKFMATPYYDIFGYDYILKQQIDEANDEIYSNLDWALDISQAEFKDCDIRGIPSRLIKRDLDTQVVIKRKNVMDNRWKEIDLSETYWGTSIEFLLEDGFEDKVLVAPKKARDFDKLLEGLNLLRDNGIAECD